MTWTIPGPQLEDTEVGLVTKAGAVKTNKWWNEWNILAELPMELVLEILLFAGYASAAEARIISLVSEQCHRLMLAALCHTVVLFNHRSLSSFCMFANRYPRQVATFTRHLWIGSCSDITCIRGEFFDRKATALTGDVPTADFHLAAVNLRILATKLKALQSLALLEPFLLPDDYEPLKAPLVDFTSYYTLPERFHGLGRFKTLKRVHVAHLPLLDFTDEQSAETVLSRLPPSLEVVEDYAFEREFSTHLPTVRARLDCLLQLKSLKRYTVVRPEKWITSAEKNLASMEYPDVEYRGIEGEDPASYVYNDWTRRIRDPDLWH